MIDAKLVYHLINLSLIFIYHPHHEFHHLDAFFIFAAQQIRSALFAEMLVEKTILLINDISLHLNFFVEIDFFHEVVLAVFLAMLVGAGHAKAYLALAFRTHT